MFYPDGNWEAALYSQIETQHRVIPGGAFSSWLYSVAQFKCLKSLLCALAVSTGSGLNYVYLDTVSVLAAINSSRA
ncbi:hypothetical protein HDF15_001000 [Granulicella mallensis]|uniref:Uncharacterized protein n=1 Tax=Granulicella mallensis TaxID=940614 RepID=A0A7W7ZMH3_9BACT|nr:hypothetical protein [Granulicella mallensis]